MDVCRRNWLEVQDKKIMWGKGLVYWNWACFWYSTFFLRRPCYDSKYNTTLGIYGTWIHLYAWTLSGQPPPPNTIATKVLSSMEPLPTHKQLCTSATEGSLRRLCSGDPRGAQPRGLDMFPSTSSVASNLSPSSRRRSASSYSSRLRWSCLRGCVMCFSRY